MFPLNTDNNTIDVCLTTICGRSQCVSGLMLSTSTLTPLLWISGMCCGGHNRRAQVMMVFGNNINELKLIMKIRLSTYSNIENVTHDD